MEAVISQDWLRVYESVTMMILKLGEKSYIVCTMQNLYSFPARFFGDHRDIQTFPFSGFSPGSGKEINRYTRGFMKSEIVVLLFWVRNKLSAGVCDTFHSAAVETLYLHFMTRSEDADWFYNTNMNKTKCHVDSDRYYSRRGLSSLAWIEIFDF